MGTGTPVMRRARALVAALAIVLPASAAAQSVATLEGRVRDDTLGIEGARVLVVDRLTNVRRRAVTGAGGFFRLLDVMPGRYDVSATMLGYAGATQAVELAAGERVQMTLALRPAPAMLDGFTVRERRNDGASVERMSVTTLLRSEDFASRPLDTRNVMDLAAVAPGMRSFAQTGGHALPAAGALRDERGLNLYVDGLELKNFNSSNVSGGPQLGTVVPVEAVDEMRVLRNPYDAEYSRGAAYVLAVESRRGTNEPHGSAFGDWQGAGLVADNDFQRAIPNFERPDANRAQAGVSLRGPLVRDRLFYAATWELTRTHNRVTVVPGQPAGNVGMWDRYAGVFDAPSRNDAAMLRLGGTVGETATLEAMITSRVLHLESGFGGTTAYESALTQRHALHSIDVRHRWLPASGIANELSVQLVRWDYALRPVNDGPTLNYPTLLIGHGDGTSTVRERQLRVVERISRGIGTGPGSHLLKGGLEIGRITTEQFSPTASNGVFRFRTETGAPSDATIGVGFTDPLTDDDARDEIDGWSLGAYVNDEWHPHARLALNVGVRWDADVHMMNNDFTVPWASDATLAARPELQGLLNRGDREDDLNNVAPRASFSWDATGTRRVFLRGGAGLMFDRIPGFIPFAERRAATWRTYTVANPATLDPADLRARVMAGGATAVPPAITLLPHRMDVPENRQWSLGLGARVTEALAVDVDYVDQTVAHLFAVVNLNWIDASQPTPRRVLSTAYANIAAWGDFACARYRALLGSATWSRDSAARVMLAYTLASARADWDNETVAVPAVAAANYYVLQRTSGDERHRVVLSGRGSGWRGVGLSFVATIASPRPYRTTVGQDLNLDNLRDDDWIDGTRYQVPPNAWRNWYRTVDVRLWRSFAVGRGRVSVTAEAFNLFNTENYSGWFGVQRSATGEPRPDFGSPSGTFATRQVRVGSRMDW